MPRNKKRPLYLTDDMILAKWGDDVDFSCKIGHEAIRQYFGYSATRNLAHEEDVCKVPVSIAKDINAGRMRFMMDASDPPYCGLAYDSRGNCIRANGLSREDYEAELLDTYNDLLKNMTTPIEPPVYDRDSGDNLKTGDRVVVLGHLASRKVKEPRISGYWPADLSHAKESMRDDIYESLAVLRTNWNSSMEKCIGKTFIVDRDIHGYTWRDSDGYLVCKLRDPETNDLNSWQWHLGSLKKI